MRTLRVMSVLLLLLGAIASCDGKAEPASPSQRKVIVASVYPLADIVRQMVDPWAEVITLLPEGADPATYELTDEQKRQVAEADMVVLAGSGIDDWAVAAQRELSPPNQRRANMVDIVALHAPPGTLQHPNAATSAERVGWLHPWLDAMCLDVFITEIARPLEPLFDDQLQVSLRGRAMLVRSNGLNIQQRVDARFGNIRFHKCIVDTHAFDPALVWAELTPVVRLEDLGLAPGQPMEAASLATLKAEVVAGTIPAIYVDRPWSAEEVQALREAAGVPVLRLNSYQPEKNVANFLELWLVNMTTIYEGQRRLAE